MIWTLFQVALGGAIGALGRHMTNLGVARLLGVGFPYGTALINVLGSFAMGVLFVMLVERGISRQVPFLMTGVLGGFTTFSAFSLDTLALVEKGQPTAAMVYVVASVGLSLGAIAAGLALGRGIGA